MKKTLRINREKEPPVVHRLIHHEKAKVLAHRFETLPCILWKTLKSVRESISKMECIK